MFKEMRLAAAQCRDAAAVQRAIDALGPGGGRVVLPAVTLTLDRGLELRDGVELVGQGPETVLRKGAGRVYPMTGYHNYGMCDVPLGDAAGLEPGMTVSVLDDQRRGFYSTFARIAWVDGNWVGLDHGIEADLLPDSHPRLTTAYPLVFGHWVRDAAVREITLDGNRAENPVAMDGCRGGCVYFARSRNIEVSGVREYDYNGEGLSFQMCSEVRILDCAFSGNTGNGLHPGAGSTMVLFENCAAAANGQAGFFFCVRANHVTVRGCRFQDNAGCGISIGTRDSHNLIETCQIIGNAEAGVCFRGCAGGTDTRCCLIRDCEISGNGTAAGQAQIALRRDAYEVVIEGNTIRGHAHGRPAPGIRAETAVGGVFAVDNVFEACDPETEGNGFVAERPVFTCGHEQVAPEDCRHLPAPARPFA